MKEKDEMMTEDLVKEIDNSEQGSDFTLEKRVCHS